MPNTRRRRFSVQNEIAGRQPTKIQNGQSSHTDSDNDIKMAVNSMVAAKPSKTRNKIYSNSSKHTLEIVAECESSTKVPSRKYSPTKAERDVPGQRKNKDPENTSSTADDSSVDQFKVPVNGPSEPQTKEETRTMNRERTPLRRDKYPRQHRIKVRSPKRRVAILDQGKSPEVLSNFSDIRSTGTAAINWDEECEIYNCENVTSVVENTDEDDRQSTHSLDDMCRICHGGEGLSPEVGRLISACLCRGTVGRVHVKCLERWLTESGKSRCELCGTRYATRRVHRYGVPRALIMWILSQNAKQLMVDSLGIMLMSPLAVLAAWLSGRTLAGLMTQESHVTPWPLASTFVLACMTLALIVVKTISYSGLYDMPGWADCRLALGQFFDFLVVIMKYLYGFYYFHFLLLTHKVCYYCWIVSAATRHALGWWIWYRSQYEVRLQLQENEE